MAFYFSDFKKGYKKGGFENIEVYQVLCHVMGLEASPHNGTWSHIADILEPSDSSGAMPTLKPADTSSEMPIIQTTDTSGARPITYSGTNRLLYLITCCCMLITHFISQQNGEPLLQSVAQNSDMSFI